MNNKTNNRHFCILSINDMTTFKINGDNLKTILHIAHKETIATASETTNKTTCMSVT